MGTQTTAIHTRKAYLMMKRNGLLSHAKTWMNLKCTLLKERSTNYIIPLHDILGKMKL